MSKYLRFIKFFQKSPIILFIGFIFIFSFICSSLRLGLKISPVCTESFMENRKISTFFTCLSGFYFFYENRNEKVYPQDLHRISLTEIGYLMIKKIVKMTAWEVPGDRRNTRGQGEMAFPQESHGKCARMNILIRVVTTLAKTVPSGATGEQKLWKLHCVN